MAQPKKQRIDPKTVPAPSATRSGTGKSGRPGGRPPGAPKVRKATFRDWVAGARPQTLALSVAPVALGTAVAFLEPHAETGPGWHWLRALGCLAVAVCLQIAVNYANDYSDGVRGTDKHRVGPARLTGSGAARPRTVLTVALVFFALAAIAGVGIVVRSGSWWLLAVGAVAILAAWFYTGGKRPYGYLGLGELVAFVFFGLVATVGTTYVLIGELPFDSWLTGSAAGFLAAATLLVNNLRDREQDILAGKRTLSVLIGSTASRVVFTVLVLLPFVILGYYTILFENAGYVYFALLSAVPAAVITIFAKTPGELVLALRLTVITSLAYGLGLGAAIAF